MQPEIQWAPLLIFLSALLSYGLIAHFRKPKARGAHRGFRRMQSPAARARKRVQIETHYGRKAVYADPFARNRQVSPFQRN